MLQVYRGFNHRFVTLSMANMLTVAQRIGTPTTHGFDKFC